MKKIIAILISAMLMLSLYACTPYTKIELPPLPTVTPTPELSAEAESTAQPTQPVRELKQAQPIIIRLKNTELSNYDPQNGETLILTYSYVTPTVYIEGRADATAKINEYTALLEEEYYTGTDYGNGGGMGYMDMLTTAEDNYNYMVETGIDGIYELSASQSISVSRADANVLCMLYWEYAYLGGVHGSYGTRAYCFDTETGERIGLSDLSADYAALEERMLSYMLNTIENNEQLKESISIDLSETGDYAELIRPIIRDGSWYFDEGGIVLFSDLYEISSYAAGPIYLNVPYSELADILYEKWLPEERDGDGMFVLAGAEEMQSGSTEIIDMLRAEGEGQSVFAVATGKLYDVVISGVMYADGFYETQQYWYCSEMDSSAVQLETMIPDGMPTLKISWRNADGEYSKLISQSGKDGSYILLDEDIAAVG